MHFGVIYTNPGSAVINSFKSLNLFLSSNPLKKYAWIWGKNSELRLSIDLLKVGDSGAKSGRHCVDIRYAQKREKNPR